MNERYVRQASIVGWDQARLTKARVVIIGSDVLAGFIGWSLAALGVGHVFIFDDRMVADGSPCFPLLATAAHQPAAPALAQTLITLNPHIEAYGLVVRLLYDAHAHAIPDCDLIIEATNDSQSKAICLAYGRQHQIPVILAASNQEAGEFITAETDYVLTVGSFQLYDDQPQGILPSQVIGGLVAGEVRRCLLPLPDDQPPAGIIRYQPRCPQRFGTFVPNQAVTDPLEGQPHVLIIGAGALGTFAALGLALAGRASRLTIVDPDRIESSNLNRQLLFYNSVGRPKATTLASQLQALCPDLVVTSHMDTVQEQHLQQADIALLCVDNFATRATVNEWAICRHLPLINGGSGPFHGEMVVYKPGQTACLGCYLGVNQLAEAEAGRRARCGDVPEPSVVISNQIIGGLMAAETARVEPLSGILAYEAGQPARIGLRSLRPACACHQGRRR